MKATLRGLFKSYGEVLDVVAHNNLRMRGQAFVSFTSIEHAKKAMKDIQRFPLYSKPIVSYRYFYAYNADFFYFGFTSANLVCEDTIRCCSEEAGCQPL